MAHVFRLCYVKPPWAFFTSADLKDQWGDDWNDAPYEHNAGPPYYWYSERKCPHYEIRKLAYYGGLNTPADFACGNSPYSVEQINAGAVAWLATDKWHEGPAVSIPAGVTIDDFVRLVERAGGEVFVKLERVA